jgi:23S rRNA (uracil1939-C5)-methyltransferase
LETGDPELTPSPAELRYRNKVTFTLRRLGKGRVVAGFRALGHRGRVLDIGDGCLLPEDLILDVWRELRSNWGPGASLLPKGRELRLTLRGGTNGVGLVVRGGSGEGRPGALLDRVTGLSSIWWMGKGGEIKHLAGDDSLQVEWGGEVLELKGGGFIQVNPGAGKALYEYVLAEAGDVREKKVIDAYCGVGVWGRALARKGASVVGVDIDTAGLSVARAMPCHGFDFVEGPVEKRLKGLLPASLVILNPPRTGLAETIPGVLERRGTDRIIYVSCDPATLARDLKRMEGGFEVEKVRSFDLFPQTGHVETVVSGRMLPH